tara:strand:- start:391 stop:1137 length:747 start_codon:yes stop_codon:yes gene_type:complete
MKKILLSIITVVKNDEKNINKTVKSIIRQKKPNYEYIIIDGGSSDNTLKAIHEHVNSIDYIKSEKDNGIYDAMNKGLKVARGDIVVFCNSGDFFYDNAFQKILELFNEKNYDFVFGTVIRNYTTTQKLKYNFSRFKLNFNFDFATSHSTGFFLKKKIYDKIGNYNLRFKCSADYDFYLRLFKNRVTGGYTKKDQLIGNVASHGYSSKLSFLDHLKEEFNIRKHNKENIFLIILIAFYSLLRNLDKVIK